MKYTGTYFSLQLKKLCQLFPRLITLTIVLTTLVSAIAFYGTKLLYQDSAIDKVTVALIVEDDSSWMQLGLQYLESSESVHSFCELVRTNQKDATQMLKNKEAAASLYFPTHFTDDVISGKNTPAILTFAGTPGIEQLLFKELANTASQILGYAQAGIYTFKDLYHNYSVYGKKGRHYDYLNEHTLQTALIRSQLFEVKQISSTKNLSTSEFYATSAIVLLIFLSVMALGSFAHAEPGVLVSLLTLHGITATKRTLLKAAALMLFYLLLLGLLFCVCICFKVLPKGCISMLPVIACLASCLTMFFYNVSGSVTTGTLAAFFSTFLCYILSGCLIPFAFLPDKLTVIGRCLPTYHLHQLLCSLFVPQSTRTHQSVLVLYSIFFLICACLCASWHERRSHTR